MTTWRIPLSRETEGCKQQTVADPDLGVRWGPAFKHYVFPHSQSVLVFYGVLVALVWGAGMAQW